MDRSRFCRGSSPLDYSDTIHVIGLASYDGIANLIVNTISEVKLDWTSKTADYQCETENDSTSTHVGIPWVSKS